METLHPGLYKQEVKGTAPMEGVSTSTGAFVGTAPRGKVGEPVLVTSWTQYVSEFDSFDNNSYLAYAVKGYFQNGGKRAYVVRTVHYASGLKTSKSASLTVGSNIAIISALNDGAWGNDIAVEMTAGSGAGLFNLVVYYQGAPVENYADISATDAEGTVSASKYITIDVIGTALSVVAKTNLAGGDDGLTDLADADFVGDEAKKTGLYALNSVAINSVAVPGITTIAVLKGLLDYANGRQDCVPVLDSPKGLSPVDVQKFVTTTANLASEYGAFYYPWLSVSDPIGVGKSPAKLVPPSGHIMGAYASMDAKAGVWRAPAGTDSALSGVLDVEYPVTDNEQDILNPNSINTIRAFTGDGILVWGARTLSKGEYKYLNVRRLAMYIESTLLANLRWTVFRPNDSVLWNATTNAVDEFLNGIWTSGGLKGSSPKEAYFIVCDSTNNTDDSVDEGKMYVDIGIAPIKPAEFIIFRLSLTR